MVKQASSDTVNLFSLQSLRHFVLFLCRTMSSVLMDNRATISTL